MAEDRLETDTAAQGGPAAGRAASPWARRLRWVAGLFLGLLLLAALVVPPVVKSQVEAQASRALRRDVRVGDIAFNPLTLSLRVGPLTVTEAGGREVAGFDELLVNVSLASLFKWAVVLDAISLQGPRLSLIRETDGRYDIADLLDEWLQPRDEPERGPPRFSLNNIRISGGRLALDDRLKGQRHEIAGLTLGLPFVSSLPYQAEIFVEPAFAAEINGSRIELKGRSKPFSATHVSELDLDLDRFDLAPLQAYLPPGLPVRLAAGQLDSELKVVFSESSEQVFSLAVTGALHLSRLALEDVAGRPLLGWERLDLDLERFDPLNQEVALRQLQLTAPQVQATVDRQGRLNWLQFAATGAPAAAAPASPPRPWRWSLGGAEVTGGRLQWHDASNAPAVQGEVVDVALSLGALDHRLAAPLVARELSFRPLFGEALQAGPVVLRDLQVDLAAQRIDIGELHNTQTRLALWRDGQGALQWLLPPQLAAAKPTPARSRAPEKPWLARLARLSVADLAVRFEDRSGKTPAVQLIEGLSLSGEQLGNEPGRKGRLSLKARVNRQGQLAVEGSVQAQPLDLALKIDAQSLPLMPLQAYFDDYLNVAVTRGQVTARGEASVRQIRGEWQAGYRGMLTLGDFLAVDRVNQADFLKWKSLYVGGIDFRSQPLAVDVAEIALSDFYSRLILDAQGQLNLQQIVRRPEAAPEGTAVPADTGASPTAPPPIRIARVTLQNGNVHFSDWFVKPNYSVNVGKLAGRITGLSSAEDSVAALELRGAYANAAPVRVEGVLNPLSANPRLDLKAEVQGVDLVGFSPYAGKYAGYAIEKGKLSLNVAYKLENRQLSADNRLFIDQFTFGEPVESPDATKLPVNLALALLKNNRGEIDINLPIAGSLDDPQFSVGGLIVKVIVNLFVKAVTSPFALLGSMFGGGEELSTVDFAPGRNSLTPAAEKKLAALAKALQARDALKLEIGGRADPDVDREGLKRVAIERAMKAEKARDLQKQTGEGRSLEAIEIAPAERATYLKRVYRDARFPKPRNLIGLQKELPTEEMEKLLLTHLPAGDDELTQLATQRAEAVQAWLVEQGAPLGRLFMLPPRVAVARDGQAAVGVEFSLK